MYNVLDEFGRAVRIKREARKITQKQLAEKLNMSHRTIMEIEICRSNPKFETVVLLSRELDISVDALIFHKVSSPNGIPKCVMDFFSDKSELEAQNFVKLCEQAEKLSDKK